MRHPKELDEKDLSEISKQVREKTAARVGYNALNSFLYLNTNVSAAFIEETYKAVRAKLEEEL